MNDEKLSTQTQLPSKFSAGKLILIGALVICIVLASSLSNLELRRNNSIPAFTRPESQGQPLPTGSQFDDTPTPLLAGTIGILFLILMVYVGVQLIKAVNLKVILRLLISMAVLLGLLYAIPQINYQATSSPPEVNPEQMIQPTEAALLEVVSPGQPPQQFVWLVLAASGLSLGLVTYLTLQKLRASDPIQGQLLAEADAAIKGLQSGKSYRNVILNCYEGMSRALIEHKEIERDFAMTVREFEEWLEELGIPPEPIHQLTKLFEEVRYGGRAQSSAENEAVAIACLNQIIQYCKLEAGT